MSVKDANKVISKAVEQTPFVDTHEHLIDESARLGLLYFPWMQKPAVDDWSILLLNYFDTDLFMAGMPESSYEKLFCTQMAPVDKWRLIEPYWRFAKNTGYGQAIRIAVPMALRT